MKMKMKIMMMICGLLLLVILTPCFHGSYVKDYEAEEDSNVTMEWQFPFIASRAANSFVVFCEAFSGQREPENVFHLHEGLEVQESQDQRFKGRIWCDRGALQDGLVRLQVSGLGTRDSGVYVCQVVVHSDVTFSQCRLNVTAARDWPRSPGPRPLEPRPPEPRPPGPTLWERISLFFGLGLVAPLLGVYCWWVCCWSRRPGLKSGGGSERVHSSPFRVV